MKTIIIITLFTFLITISSMASESFMLGASPNELRKAYGTEAVTLSSDTELAFDTHMGGTRCTIVYRLEHGAAVSALCLVPTENRRFLDSLKDFRAILDIVLKDGKATETSIRMNGVTIIGGGRGLKVPNNYIRVSGGWRSQFCFTAGLDGDDAAEIQDSGVRSLSVEVNRKVEPPAAPL